MNILLFWACLGHILETSGELGRINYRLESTYKLDTRSLADVKLVTGYAQNIAADLTPLGWRVTEEPYLGYHTADAVLSLENASIASDWFGFPDFTLLSAQEGNFPIETFVRDQLIDRIELEFARPDDLSVISWIRAPEADEFQKHQEEIISVQQGAQIAFIPIPMNEGERLVGEISVEVTVEPSDAAVIGQNIEQISEDGVQSSSSPTSLYFVRSGSVSVGIRDVVNDVTAWQEFLVE